MLDETERSTVLKVFAGALSVNWNDATKVSYAFTQPIGLINDTDLAIGQLEGYKYKRYQKMIERIKSENYPFNKFANSIHYYHTPSLNLTLSSKTSLIYVGEHYDALQRSHRLHAPILQASD